MNCTKPDGEEGKVLLAASMTSLKKSCLVFLQLIPPILKQTSVDGQAAQGKHFKMLPIHLPKQLKIKHYAEYHIHRTMESKNTQKE